MISVYERHRQTDGQTTHSTTALCSVESRAVIIITSASGRRQTRQLQAKPFYCRFNVCRSEKLNA